MRLYFIVITLFLCYRVSSYVQHLSRIRKNRPLLAGGDDDRKEAKLCEFIRDAESWGTCRFVVQGEGTILESLGRLTELRTSANPKSGETLITLSSHEIPGFECHIRAGKVRSITNAEVSKFDKKLRITRLIGEDDKNLLSIILSESDQNGVKAWESTRKKFGDAFSLPIT